MIEPSKVTDPDKIVTDSVLLSALEKQGIDKDFVEFFQDYSPRSLGKEHSPYAKFYRDLQSNKRFMVVSGLPMVDADGVKIECGWKVAGINYFSEKNNLFRAKVQGTDVELTIRNDQPDGRKADDKLSYKPQLFLDGIEQLCGQPSLLPVDPVNPKYLENTLEWDYGICKRRLRIIAGSILGTWVFAQMPSGEVGIKYNQTGDFRLRLGQFKLNDDEEVVKPEGFDFLSQFQNGYPVAVSDSATFYPDAHPETTSVDGYVGSTAYASEAGVDWATLRADAGGQAGDTQALYGTITDFLSDITPHTNKWRYLYRCIILFDTSGLPDSATISAATLSLYGHTKTDPTSNTPDVNIYSSAPASDTALVNGDFDSLGDAPLCGTPITYGNWNILGYNDFIFNAAGLATISKTGVSKFGTRGGTKYDITGASAPTWGSYVRTYIYGYMAEQGNGYKPKLVVTYSTGGGTVLSGYYYYQLLHGSE